MGWEKVGEIVSKMGTGGGGQDYVKFVPGEAVSGVFVGEPLCFYKNFQMKQEVEKWQEGFAFRFKVNFAQYNAASKAWEIKLVEQGKTFLKSVYAFIQEYGQDTLFKIKREGKGQEDTVYHIFFVRKLEPGEVSAIANAKSFDLHIMGQQKQQPKPQHKEISMAEEFGEETDEESALRRKIVDKVIDLVGSSAKDIEDFVEATSEWRDSQGNIKVKGVREVSRLRYKPSPGKENSQAEVFYGMLKRMDKQEAVESLNKWRASNA